MEEKEREREERGEIRCRRKRVEKWKDRDERQQGWRRKGEFEHGIARSRRVFLGLKWH